MTTNDNCAHKTRDVKKSIMKKCACSKQVRVSEEDNDEDEEERQARERTTQVRDCRN
jgi:hypothetical protein